MYRQRILKVILLLIFLTGSVVSALAGQEFTINGKKPPKVVATVNGVKLSDGILQNQVLTFRLTTRRAGHAVMPKAEEAFVKEALHKMVSQELVFQKAKALGIHIGSKTVDAEIKKIAEQFPSDELFRTALQVQGLTPELLHDSIERQLAEEEYIRREIAPKVKVNDAAVESYYKSHTDEFRVPKKYTVHHIFTSAMKPDPARKPKDPAVAKRAERMIKMIDTDARKKIEALQKLLKGGRDFEELAIDASEDEGSGQDGGLLGTVKASDTFPEMEKVIVKMKANETSDIVRSEYGYHLIKVKKIIPASVTELSEVKADILNHLLKEALGKARDAEVERMRKKAKIKLHF